MMEKSMKEGGTYGMYKDVNKFLKDVPYTPTITEGEYTYPNFDHTVFGVPRTYHPSEIHVTNRTPEDDLRAEGYRYQQMRDENPPNKDEPLSEEEKQMRLDNINQNNMELGLKSKSQEPVERIASGKSR